MRKIRVANVSFLSGIPFRALTNPTFFPYAEFIEYQENLPTENARKLSEGEVDIALVGSSDFAVHGGYVGMDFGVSVWERSDNIFLYAKEQLSKLQAIHLFPGSGSSSYLLRLLCRQHWNITPRFIRSWQTLSATQPTENEGVLVRHLIPHAPQEPFVVSEDIAEIWCQMTGKPFVFLVWAIRPGTLHPSEHSLFQDVFHRCSRVVSQSAKAHAADFGMSPEACADFILSHYQYYLDEPNLAGMEEFFKQCARHNLLPEARYQSATVKLLNPSSVGGVRDKTIDALLDDVVQGVRIGVKDAIRVAEQASVSDLGTAADLIRRKLFPARLIHYTFSVREQNLRNAEADIFRRLEAAGHAGLAHVCLQIDEMHPGELSQYERWLHTLKNEMGMFVEGFTVSEVIAVARRMYLPIQEVISRLITAGLDLFSGQGGGMLIDKFEEHRLHFHGVDQAPGELRHLRPHEWIEAMRCVHRFGARSTCSMTLSPDDTWEDRVLHMQKIRMLQDENPGFRSFFLDPVPQCTLSAYSELKLRAQMLARLFLDNIPSIQELSVGPSDLPGVLGLTFGANEIYIELNTTDDSQVTATMQTLKSLQDLGMDFERPVKLEGLSLHMH